MLDRALHRNQESGYEVLDDLLRGEGNGNANNAQ
jgi:hypothetical protein